MSLRASSGATLVGISLGLIAGVSIGWILGSGRIENASASNQKNGDSAASSSSAINPDSNSRVDITSAASFSQQSSKIVSQASSALFTVTVVRDNVDYEDKELQSYYGQLGRTKRQDVGSAFAVTPDGYLVCCYHVVRNSKSIRVEDQSGTKWPGALYSHDALTDIAVLKIDEKGLAPLQWRTSDGVQAGSLVWIGGAPFGLKSSFSMGILSSKGRTRLGGSPLVDFLQTDASIHPGNSGGPMFDLDGKVIGVVSSILGEKNEGIAFAIPSSIAQPVSEQLITKKSVVRGWIGIQAGVVPAEKRSDTEKYDFGGAIIEWIDERGGDGVKASPAMKAKLRVGDICVQCNKFPIDSPVDLARKIAFSVPGDTLDLMVLREGSEFRLQVTVEALPSK